MTRLKTITTFSSISMLAFIFALAFSTPSFAHVVVRPAEVVTAGYQTFTVSVPNEKDIATVSIKVVIPESLQNITPTQKNGWQISKENDRTGENAKTTSITWEGGSITEGTRDEFTFSAKTPEKATTLQWKAYQTYSDGTVVSWDQEPSDGHSHDHDKPNSGLYSETKIVSLSTQDESVQIIDQAAADAKIAAERSLYAAFAALALSVVGVFLALRKK